jgi:hypothetical protein
LTHELVLETASCIVPVTFLVKVDDGAILSSATVIRFSRVPLVHVDILTVGSPSEATLVTIIRSSDPNVVG